MATHASILAGKSCGQRRVAGYGTWIHKESDMTKWLTTHTWSFLALALSVKKALATHSSTLAWEIPWTEEPGRLQFMGSLRVGHDRATSLSCIGEGNGNPLQCSCLENPRDGGTWWAAVYGVTQSRTRLKRLSSSSPVIESNQLISEQKFLFEILHDIREEKAPLFYLIIF